MIEMPGGNAPSLQVFEEDDDRLLGHATLGTATYSFRLTWWTLASQAHPTDSNCCCPAATPPAPARPSTTATSKCTDHYDREWPAGTNQPGRPPHRHLGGVGSSVNAVAWSVAHWRNDLGGDPRRSDTVEVMNAGFPIAAAQAASSISTTGRGQLPDVSLRN